MNLFSRVLPAAAVLSALAIAPRGPAQGDKPEIALCDHAAEIKRLIDKEYKDLEALYKHLHQNPELSYQEEQTARRMAKELKALGFEVTEKVGGHGVVGIFKNGPGPTVMVRCDMDALPIVERTGLPYASKVKVRDAEGKEVGVMHACGHDMHMTCWVGAARVLVPMKERWSGTLMFIAQPAEERGGGARAMLEEGLFKKWPKPDYAFALHCDGWGPHGQIRYTEGQALANVDSVDVVIRGRGGHGSAPHTTVDPIVVAAKFILDLQTLVSRERDPSDPAVVTVGSIHGGTKHNIIPNDVKLQITVRTFKDSTRKAILEGIERKAKAAAESAAAPPPEVKVDPGEFTPSLHNDPALTRKTVAAFKEILGDDKVHPRPPGMGGEDFGRYGRAGVPIFMFWLGTVDPEMVEKYRQEGRPLPSMHSDAYYPVVEPSIRTGVLCMSAAVLNLLGR
jgi:amidohydrolase